MNAAKIFLSDSREKHSIGSKARTACRIALASSLIFSIFLAGAVSADRGSSTTYTLAVQTNSFNNVGDSTSYSFAADSGTGSSNSSSYRFYGGYATFLATPEQIPAQPLINFAGLAGEPIVYQGTTAKFQVTVKNMGSVDLTIVPRLYIYNSAGALAFQRVGTSTELEAGATASLLQYNTLVLSVGMLPAGTYNATVNILYTDPNNQINVTQNMSIMFEIRAVSTTTSPGGGVVYVVPQLPSQVGPEEPERDFVEFISVPVLVEIGKGSQRDEVLTISNPTDGKITGLTLSVKGVPKSWVAIDDILIDLEAGEQRDIALTFAVPDGAVSGNYVIMLLASNNIISQASSILLHVTGPLKLTTRSGDVQPQYVYINRVVKVDTRAQKTAFTLNVHNTDVRAESLTVTERINKKIAESVDEVIFLTEPSKIVERDPVVEWLLKDVKKNEERNISYYVNKVVNETDAFVYTSVEQVALIAGLPEQPLEFQIDSNTLLTLMLAVLTAASAFGAYKMEYKIRKKIYAKGIPRFIGRPILTAETGRKLGIVDDITFMPTTGEILDIVVKNPTAYARRLLVKKGVKNRLYVPFQSIKGIGDYVVVTESDIIFEAAMRKRPAEEEQTSLTKFYKSTIKKVKPSDAIEAKAKQTSVPKYINQYSFDAYKTEKPATIRAHLKELKHLYRDGVIGKKTYMSTKKRLLEGLEIVKTGENESVIEKIKNRLTA